LIIVHSMAAQQSVVLQQLGQGWLQCQDQEGIFYYNSVTKQESVDVPMELRPAMQVAPQYAPAAQAVPAPAEPEKPVVKMQFGDWMVCEDSQGEFYYHELSKQSFDTPPPELVEVFKAHQMKSKSSHHANPALPSSAYMQQVAGVSNLQMKSAQPTASSQQQAEVKAQFGDWLVCVDAQGEFYYNQSTHETYESPPPEFLAIYGKLQQGHQKPHQVQQVQTQNPQVQLQKAQQVQQELYKKHQQQLFQAQQLKQQQQQLQQLQAQQQQQPPKIRLGDWAVHEDAQGEFYVHEPTGQSYETMPEELLQMYQLELRKQELKKMQKIQQAQQQQMPSQYTLPSYAQQYQGKGSAYAYAPQHQPPYFQQ
jgi:hypothetical protein